MYDVVTIGTATRDIFLRSALFRTIHDPQHLRRLGFPGGNAQCFALGGKLEVDQPVLTIGGGAVNAAVTFSRQGLKAAAIVKIANDDNGHAVLSDLQSEKVKALPVFDVKVGTAFSVLLLSSEGERTILSYRGASEDLKKEEALAKTPKSRWAYIVPGHIQYEVIHALIKKLVKQGTRIAMNPSNYYLSLEKRKLEELLVQCEVVLLNREEAAALTGVPYEEKHEIFEKFMLIPKTVAVMTDGHKGAWVSYESKIHQAGVYKEKQILDRTGAGDAFGSGFVSALAQASKLSSYSGETIAAAVRLASANATSVVEHIGAQEGILRKKDFSAQSRWRRLPLRIL